MTQPQGGDPPSVEPFRVPSREKLDGIAVALAELVALVGPNAPAGYADADARTADPEGWQVNLTLVTLYMGRKTARLMREVGMRPDRPDLAELPRSRYWTGPKPGYGWFYDTAAAIDLARSATFKLLARWGADYPHEAPIHFEGMPRAKRTPNPILIPLLVEPAEFSDLAWCSRTIATGLARARDLDPKDAIEFSQPTPVFLNDGRDRWITERLASGTPEKEIVAELKEAIRKQGEAGQKRWGMIGSENGLVLASRRYRKRHGLAPLPSRKAGQKGKGPAKPARPRRTG